MTRQDAPEIIRRYREAYLQANGYECSPLTYERGWFVFHHAGHRDGRYRAAKLREMTERLALRASLGS